MEFRGRYNNIVALTSVADPDPNPDPPNPSVFGPPGSGSINQRYRMDPDPFIIKEK
jgi:hypothetical protein